MLELLGIAISLGAVTAYAGWKVNGIWFGGATLFWLSWSGFIASAVVGTTAGTLAPPPESSSYFVQRAFIGAFVGGMAGIWLAGKASERVRDSRRWRELVGISSWLLQRTVPLACFALVVAGTLHFYSRWSVVDFDLTRIGDVRSVQGAEWGGIARVASYLSLGCTALLILMGVHDAGTRMHYGRVVMVWLANLPHGLAFAGRGWTLAPLVIYFLSLMLGVQCSGRKLTARSLLPLGLCVVLGLWMFTALGVLRGSGRDAPSASVAEAASIAEWEGADRLMAANWLGSSFASVGVHSSYVETLEPSWGEATFEYFYRKAYRWGWIERFKMREWDEWRESRLIGSGEHGSTWCVPPTAVAYLVFDFGDAGMPVAMGLVLALLHWLSVRWIGQGLFRNTVAFLAFNSIFNTIQTLVLFTSLNVVVLFWAACAEVAAKRVPERWRRAWGMPAVKT